MSKHVYEGANCAERVIPSRHWIYAKNSSACARDGALILDRREGGSKDPPLLCLSLVRLTTFAQGYRGPP
jgi:hypothetical protein